MIGRERGVNTVWSAIVVRWLMLETYVAWIVGRMNCGVRRWLERRIERQTRKFVREHPETFGYLDLWV